MTKAIRQLKTDYRKRKIDIKKRLKEFSCLYKANNKRVFAELCFCILTPQSKAIYCDEAIQQMVTTGVLFSGRKIDIKNKLHHVRFSNNKSRYIITARKLLQKNNSSIFCNL